MERVHDLLDGYVQSYGKKNLLLGSGLLILSFVVLLNLLLSIYALFWLNSLRNDSSLIAGNQGTYQGTSIAPIPGTQQFLDAVREEESIQNEVSTDKVSEPSDVTDNSDTDSLYSSRAETRVIEEPKEVVTPHPLDTVVWASYYHEDLDKTYRYPNNWKASSLGPKGVQFYDANRKYIIAIGGSVPPFGSESLERSGRLCKFADTPANIVSSWPVVAEDYDYSVFDVSNTPYTILDKNDVYRRVSYNPYKSYIDESGEEVEFVDKNPGYTMCKRSYKGYYLHHDVSYTTPKERDVRILELMDEIFFSQEDGDTTK